MTSSPPSDSELTAEVQQPALHRRRRLLVLREAQRDQASYESPQLFRDPETWIVNYDATMGSGSLPPALAQLDRRSLLRPDQIYILSPYDDVYIPAYEAEEAFAQRKFEIFTNLCGTLGAREVLLTRTDVDETTQQRSASVTAKKLGTSASANLTQDLRDRLAQTMSMSTTFSGGPPDIDAAADLLEQHSLDHDSTMRGLLDLFRRGTNRVTSQELRLNVTSEASRELKAVASLKIPTTLSISATFNDLRSQVQEVLVELKVNF